MYQTPSHTPPRQLRRRSRKRRSDRGRISLSLELVLAAGLTVAVAAGLVTAGGSWRPLEVVVLLAGTALGLATGWPVSGHAALGTAAAYLILETVFGRLDGGHLPGLLLLTAGMLGSVLAAGFARRRYQARPARAATEPESDPWANEVPGQKHLTAGTLDYEIERARRAGRPLSLLAVRPDELLFLAAAGSDSLMRLLDLLENAIESTVRAIDVVSRTGPARFGVVLPETGAEGARTIAERIRLRIDSTRPEPSAGKPAGTSVSIGVATYPADGTDEVTLEAAAGRALEHAAGLGGNRTVLYSLPEGAPPGWALSQGGRESVSAAGDTTLRRPQP
jgi:diguanylate cyclase (GGDEF)-like protein